MNAGGRLAWARAAMIIGFAATAVACGAGDDDAAPELSGDWRATCRSLHQTFDDASPKWYEFEHHVLFTSGGGEKIEGVAKQKVGGSGILHRLSGSQTDDRVTLEWRSPSIDHDGVPAETVVDMSGPSATPLVLSYPNNPTYAEQAGGENATCTFRAGRWDEGVDPFASTGDCSPGGDACDEEGRCSEAYGVCVAASGDDCAGAEVCKDEGRCTAGFDGCVVGSNADCAAQPGCLDSGRCTAMEYTCVVGSDADCQQSYICKQHEQCKAYEVGKKGAYCDH